jgi:peptidoglycan glycosyltransferase
MGTRWIALLVFAVWGAVIAGTFLRYGTSGEKIFSNPRNKRIFYEPRGQILDRNGTVLAHGDGSNRYYPLGKATSHVLGYFNPKIGAGGMIEGNYGHLLREISQTKYLYFINRPSHRASLKTTLDVKLQRAADNALGEKKGAVIVLKVETGEILALVSHPSFNPNGLDRDWKRVIALQKEAPLLNRVTSGHYSPGSVWKVVDTLCLLEKGDPGKEYYCNGIYTIGDREIGCPVPHGQVNGLEDAFVRSCNSYFIDRIIKEVNPEEFFRVSSIFAKQKTNERMNSQDYALAAIGQGVIELTPLEGALLAATVANKGLMPSPVFVLKEHLQGKKILNEANALQLQRMMVDVVKRGTGRGLTGFISRKYKIGVKTGTAEKRQSGNDKTNIAWIIGFAGKKEPEIAFATVIEETTGYGGEVCSPIVRSVLTTYFSGAK